MNSSLPTRRIVAVVDGKGSLKCARCVDVTSFDRGYVWDDSYPHNVDPCDICGQPPVETVRVTELKRGDNVQCAGSVWKITNDPYVRLGYVQCDLDAGYGRTGRFEFRSDTSIPVAH